MYFTPEIIVVNILLQSNFSVDIAITLHLPNPKYIFIVKDIMEEEEEEQKLTLRLCKMNGRE